MTKDILITEGQMREALVKADCPEELIERIGEALSLWWKLGWIQEILLHQADIAYKAGRQSVLDGANAGTVSVNDLLREANEAVIREVVDWGSGYCPHTLTQIIDGAETKKRECEVCWQAFLKEH